MQETMPVWPVPYVLRKSRRTKHFHLRFNRQYELEVVYPYWSSQKQAVAFFHEQKSWVMKHYPKMRLRALQYRSLPLVMDLQALCQQWYIDYTRSSTAMHCKEQGNRIYIEGNIDNHQLVRKHLRQWLSGKAHAYLSHQLSELSQLTGISYNGMKLGNQQTLWGACSSHGIITLNIKLMLMSQAIVRYVIIHELCHRRHFDHSAAFWSLVEKFEPDYRQLKQHLKQDPVHVAVFLYE